jgi:hypothetical protein
LAPDLLSRYRTAYSGRPTVRAETIVHLRIIENAKELE